MTARRRDRDGSRRRRKGGRPDREREIVIREYYSHNGIEIWHGDALDVLAGMPECSIDLTVTSPPYDNLRTYNGYSFDFEGIAKQLYRVTRPGGVVVWVVADATIKGSETGTSFRQALYFKEIGFNLHDTMIYFRRAAPLTHKRYEQEFEYMFVFAKGNVATFNAILEPKRWLDKRQRKVFRRERDGSHDTGYSKQTTERIRGNVWEMPSGLNRSTLDKIAFEHPAIFPEALANDHIKSWSNPGDTVLDCFCGSGTTGKMAIKNGRHFIGIDISEEYCALTVRRLA